MLVTLIFLHVTTMFLPFEDKNFIKFELLHANAFNSDQAIILFFGKELN